MEGFIKELEALAALSGEKCDFYIERSHRLEAVVNDGVVEKTLSADSFGAGIRVFRDNKLGSAYFTSADIRSAKDALAKAKEAAVVEGYEGYELPAACPKQEKSLCDPGHSGYSLKKFGETGLAVESACKSVDNVRFARDITVSAEKQGIWLINSSGFSGNYEKTYYKAFVSAISSGAGCQETADAFAGSGLLSAIDPAALGKNCGMRAAALLGSKTIKSGHYTLILPPHTSSDFTALLSRLFLADQAQKGKSLLAGKKPGDTAASKCVTICDDSLLDFCAGSRPFDDEGTEAFRRDVISSGVFSTFLYDIMSAQRSGMKRTGNSSRQDFKSLPECGPSNFYIKPGSCKSGSESGLEINSLMGLHMTDTVSGNFSLSANGWLTEKGERKMPVREILITGNIRDMLMNIEKVCDDLEFFGRFGSPTIVVSGAAVAGK